MQIRTSKIVSFIQLILLSACASQSKKEAPYVPPTKANTNMSTWDYNKIREARETEKASTVDDLPSAASDTKDCEVMTQEAMVRAKVTGCRPIDPRVGNGENAYCCPKKN
jgi:hypothetical protein